MKIETRTTQTVTINAAEAERLIANAVKGQILGGGAPAVPAAPWTVPQPAPTETVQVDRLPSGDLSVVITTTSVKTV